MKQEDITKEVTKEILKIQTDLDIGAKGMAKAMGVTYATFRKKKSSKVPEHSFNQKNLIDLKDYLKNYFENL